MTVNDRTRMQLHQKLEAVPGTEEANTLMAHLPPVTWQDVATKDDVRGLREELHSVESVIRGDMRAEFADFRGETNTEFANVRAEIAGLRGDMHTEIAGLRGEIHRAANDQTKWMVGFICGWSVLVVTVARLVL